MPQPYNPISVRLLAKAGFEREGLLRKLHLKNGVHLDAVVMALVRRGVVISPFAIFARRSALHEGGAFLSPKSLPL